MQLPGPESKASQFSSSNAFITGDFNYPEIDWEIFKWPESLNEFMNVVLDSNWSQMVSAPTRENNVLDLLFTKNPESVLSVTVEEPLGDSDHSMVLAKLSISNISKGSCPHGSRFNWKKADWTAFQVELQRSNWCNFYDSDEVDIVFHNMVDCIWSACIKSVPLTSYKNQKRPVWETKMVRDARKHRREAELRYRLHRTNDSRIARNKAANHLKQTVKRAVIDYERSIASCSDPKRFWKYVRTRQRPHSRVGPLYDAKSGTVTHDPKECARLFAEEYSSYFTTDDKNVPILPLQNQAEFTSICFYPALLQTQLKRMRNHASPGPDGITYLMLKGGGLFLLQQLSTLYQYCLDRAITPSQWKSAFVVPIFKKGDRTRVTNYRPVSLISCVAKLMEACVRNELLNFWRSNATICPSQFGFIPNSSCCHQLIVYLDNVTEIVDKGLCVDAIYLDLAKAFNTVSHSRLLTKLGSMGIGGYLLKWLESFLCGRKEVVCVLGERSTPYTMASGVPQGSVLGPLLFVAYVNDVDTCINRATLLKYADDMKIYIELQRTQQQYSLLQDDLNSLQRWLEDWQLRLAPEKCKVMHFGRKNPSIAYALKDMPVKESSVERDLGVFISSDLNFDYHISKIVKKAEGMLASITRAFVSRSPHVYLKLFNTLVRPLLEYASPVWNPTQINHCKRIEAVQRRATRRIPGMCSLPYTQRLLALKLDSLEFRRRVADLIMAYKLVRTSPHCDSLFNFASSSRTRGHNFKIRHQYVNLNLRKHFFTARVVDDWNSLPSHVVNTDSLKFFKAAVTEELKAKYA